MAKEQPSKKVESIKDLDKKISIGTYGVTPKLDAEQSFIRDLVKRTASDTVEFFGQKAIDNKVINNSSELAFNNIFSSTSGKDKKKSEQKEFDFKEVMSNNSEVALNMQAAEQIKLSRYKDYRLVSYHIPECALALETYLSNILSPDDFSKIIFDIDYDGTTDEKKRVIGELKDIIDKYEIEDKSEDIIKTSLIFGESFLAILPYSKELPRLLQSNQELLSESSSNNFVTLNEATLLEDLDLNESEKTCVKEVFGESNTNLAQMLNENFKLLESKELLQDRVSAERDALSNNMIDIDMKSAKKSKSPKLETLNINGSAIRTLEPDRVIKLQIDNVCYGYYYIEPGYTGIDNAGFNSITSGTNSSSYMQTTNPVNQTLSSNSGGDANKQPAGDPTAKHYNISDDKLHLLSGIILKGIGKKLNKDYIKNNKEFKDLIYGLLQQEYFIKKGVGITYFLPSEVVHFDIKESIYHSILHYTRLYLAVLTNTVLIKLGRGHDRRLYTVNTSDGNYEQAIMKTIQDVKTKEFRMSDIGNIGSILSLNPGRFDDIFMPQINGESPIHIDVLPGMDTEMNNEFMAWLKSSIIQGMGLPLALTDASENLEFARTISAQNGAFVRRIVRIQKRLTKPFTKLVQLLYSHENENTSDGKNTNNKVDINHISISFPSPASLSLTNTLETLTSIEQKADVIAKAYIVAKTDGSTDEDISLFKYKIIKDETPQLDWEKYDLLYEDFKAENGKLKVVEKAKRSKKAAAGLENPNEQYDDGGFGQY